MAKEGSERQQNPGKKKKGETMLTRQKRTLKMNNPKDRRRIEEAQVLENEG